jgi:hypothetical protein
MFLTMAAALVSIAGGLGEFGSAAAADEDDGLELVGTTTFRLEPDHERVRVTVDITVTNQKPDNGSLYYFFDEILVPAPGEATDVVAVSSGGSVLNTRVGETNEAWKQLVVVLPSRLLYGQTASLQVAYDLPNQPPRSDGWTYANAAYASFPVFAVGDPGLADVTVLLPDDYEVNTVGETMLESEDTDLVVLSETDIGTPEEWWAVISAQNNNRLETRTVTAEGTTVQLKYWPGDDEWADFVEDQIVTGLPALESVIGEPLPVDGELEIIESGTPHVLGWGGWYDSANETIEIGDELDAPLVLHEITHAWFNSETAADLWLIEGLTETVTHRALTLRDGESASPKSVSPDDDGAQPLGAWTATGLAANAEPTAEDDFGYNAAWWVLSELADEMGEDKFTEVTSAIVRGVMPYQADEEVLLPTESLTWRRTLDLFEEVGGATSVTDVYLEWVVEEQNLTAIDERTNAREIYYELDEGVDGWSPPLDIRNDMTEWQFGSVAELADVAHEVLADRDATLEVVSRFGVDDLAEFEAAYESASDVTEVATLGGTYAEVADTIDEAQAEPGFAVATLSNIGLIGYDVDDALAHAASALQAGDIEEAKTYADDAMSQVDDAPTAGAMRLGILTLLVLGVAIFWWKRARRRGRLAGLQSSQDSTTPPDM